MEEVVVEAVEGVPIQIKVENGRLDFFCLLVIICIMLK